MPAHGGYYVCVEVVLMSPHLKSGGGIALVFDRCYDRQGDTSNYMIH